MPSTLAMQAAAPARAATVGALRQALRRLETAGLDTGAAPLAFDIPELDLTLGGGLARGALHELAAPRESGIAAASGFALALTGLLPPPASLVWIGEDMALLESGAPHGPGLDDLGLPPERLLLVATPKPRDVLWAMEEALRCRAVGAVVAELRGKRAVDLVVTRRLSLAAAASGALGLLLRTQAADEASAAVTRWSVAAAPSAADPARGPGPPRFAVSLVRNRRGPLGSWTLEYSRDQRFVLAAYPQPVAAPAAHRPPAAGVG